MFNPKVEAFNILVQWISIKHDTPLNMQKVWNAMTCISQLMEGGVYLILYMVKKNTGPQLGHQMYVRDFSPKWKNRERKPRVQVYWMEGKTELPLVRTDSCVSFPS